MSIFKTQNLADKSTDLISVAKHTLEKIEKKNILPDLVYIVTESFPLREENLLEMMFNKLKNGLKLLLIKKRRWYMVKRCKKI